MQIGQNLTQFDTALVTPESQLRITRNFKILLDVQYNLKNTSAKELFSLEVLTTKQHFQLWCSNEAEATAYHAMIQSKWHTGVSNSKIVFFCDFIFSKNHNFEKSPIWGFFFTSEIFKT